LGLKNHKKTRIYGCIFEVQKSYFPRLIACFLSIFSCFFRNLALCLPLFPDFTLNLCTSRGACCEDLWHLRGAIFDHPRASFDPPHPFLTPIRTWPIFGNFLVLGLGVQKSTPGGFRGPPKMVKTDPPHFGPMSFFAIFHFFSVNIR